MVHAAPARTKIPTKIPQPARAGAFRPARPKARRTARSRKHAHTQRRLCERFAAPVIGDVLCLDIKTWHMQQVVNAAPTAKEGARVHGMISAMVGAGFEGGYLASPRLAKVHWQAAGRPLPPPRVSVAGESGLWIDPAEIPSADDVERLGKALAAGRHGDQDELMANVAAYSGLRWGRDRRPHRASGGYGRPRHHRG
jgi:hypothetical protein